MLKPPYGPQFNSFSISSVDSANGILNGRPYGGLSILWHKRLDATVSIEQYNDSRILGIKLVNSETSLHIVNVYLPFESVDNFENYIMYMGKIANIVNMSSSSNVIVLGDFNAHPDGVFYNELSHMCTETDLTILDVEELPPNTFTHVNNGTLAQRWLDHCVVSQSVRNNVDNMYIDNDYACSDHFPLYLSVNLDFASYESDQLTGSKINWNFKNERLRELFYFRVCSSLADLDLNPNYCTRTCSISEHKHNIEKQYGLFVNTIISIAKDVFGVLGDKSYVVPGWNQYISEFYHGSREAFLAWRSAGSPREGIIAYRMRAARANFKYALRQCRQEEDRIRAELLSSKLCSGDVAAFWHQMRNIKGSKNVFAKRVDGAVGAKEINNLWRDKFQDVLNSVDDSRSKAEFQDRVTNPCGNSFDWATVSETNSNQQLHLKITGAYSISQDEELLANER
ncbi:hypothetical protein SNEBB_004870 [Seison nebaliae]|nr:hypothetical protein SNEBB_004870 [Seison nebaliae]